MDQQPVPHTGNRRRQYLIDNKFQKSLMLKMALLVVATIAGALGITSIYVKLIHLASATPALAAPIPAVNPAGSLHLAQVMDFLWIPGLITALLATVAVLIFGMFYSHRIAGPLFNLKRMMSKVEGGNLNVTMRIRASDEFHDVEASFNQMISSLNRRLEAVRQVMQELPAPARRKLERALRDHFAIPEEEAKPELTTQYS